MINVQFLNLDKLKLVNSNWDKYGEIKRLENECGL